MRKTLWKRVIVALGVLYIIFLVYMAFALSSSSQKGFVRLLKEVSEVVWGTIFFMAIPLILAGAAYILIRSYRFDKEKYGKVVALAALVFFVLGAGMILEVIGYKIDRVGNNVFNIGSNIIILLFPLVLLAAMYIYINLRSENEERKFNAWLFYVLFMISSWAGPWGSVEYYCSVLGKECGLGIIGVFAFSSLTSVVATGAILIYIGVKFIARMVR